MDCYAALHFAWDENLRDKTYWYRTLRALAVGEEVFAPVGPHDRIQRAVVVRTARDLPYGLAFIKCVEEEAEGEFGGKKYDDRHYTAFGRLIKADKAAGGRTFLAPKKEDESVYRALLAGDTVYLVGGDADEIFALLFAFVRGKEDLAFLNFTEEEYHLLAARLTAAA